MDPRGLRLAIDRETKGARMGPRSRCRRSRVSLLPSVGLGVALGVGASAGLTIGCERAAPREARPASGESVEPSERSEQGQPAREGEPNRAVDDPVPASTQAPASREALSAEERRRFQAAVAEGRRLHGQRDFEGAIEAYARALDLLPDDPRTLSEQGWAMLFAGRLDEAEAVLRRAEAGVGDEPRLYASILYNLGRVAEARGRDAVAIDAYQRSLQLRPHPSVYRHLSGLEGGSRYAFGPEVRPLQGPYARLGDLCQEERRLTASQRDQAHTDSFACLSDAAKGLGGSAVQVPSSRRLPAPWTGLRFVEVRPNAYTVRFHAALQTDAGWFVLPDVATLARGMPGTTERATRLVGRAEALFSGGAPQIVLEVETRWAITKDGREQESEVHRVEFLCGRGDSGAPSCTGALPRATEARRRDADGVEQTRWAIERRALPEGIVVLEGDPRVLDEPAAAVLGTHRVEFL